MTQLPQDTGKLSDMVRLTLTITDRTDRTHTYAYRNVMRYQCDERDDGHVFITFQNEPFDRIHQAISEFNKPELKGAELMRFLLAQDPRLLSGDPEAAGSVVGIIAVALGALLSLIEIQVDEGAAQGVRQKLIELMDRNRHLSTLQTLEMLERARNGETIFNKQP